MFPKDANFRIKVRDNSFLKNKIEYALYVTLDKGDQWVVHTWTQKPSKTEIKTVIEIVLRSFEVYHNNITFSRPMYKMDVVSNISGLEE